MFSKSCKETWASDSQTLVWQCSAYAFQTPRDTDNIKSMQLIVSVLLLRPAFVLLSLFRIRRVNVFLSMWQEAAINVFSTIKKYMDDQTMRKLVLPKAKVLFTKSNNVRVIS